MSKFKIRSLRIIGYNQFKDFYCDFTNPETGEAAEKICFIGPNGTGKSTLLLALRSIIPQESMKKENQYSLLFIEYQYGSEEVLVIMRSLTKYYDSLVMSINDKTKKAEIFDIIEQHLSDTSLTDSKLKNGLWNALGQFDLSGLKKDLTFQHISSHLVIYAPPEAAQNSQLTVATVPKTNLNEAMNLFSSSHFDQVISNESVVGFWEQLIYLTKHRYNLQNEYENLPENLAKTKMNLIAEFDKIHPKILDALALLWNRILEKCELEFDVSTAKVPFQLTDNLEAFITTKKTNQIVPYNKLSTGIRMFIFKVGHIFSLYFNREIERGILLVDEPENSLFPDFLYDLIDIYKEITTDKNGENNTQMFFATHNPIIAAQFEPWQRIILEWDGEGGVKSIRGTAPVGDDPNDLLKKDFGIRSLMGEEGRKMWEEYLQLRKTLRNTSDEGEKNKLLERITKIGSDYNFDE